MSTHKIVLKSLSGALSMLAVAYAVGCGGSAFTDGGGGGGTSSAGTSSSAGTTSSAGTSSSGGSGGHGCDARTLDCASPRCSPGQIPVTPPGGCCPTCYDGGGGSGGGGGCADIACAAIACPSGSKSVILNGECCPNCVPDGDGGTGGCPPTTCPGLLCKQGYTLKQLPGECCASCVPDDACSKGQKGYQALRQKLLAPPAALACKIDADCTLLTQQAYCGDQCSAIPANAEQAKSINQQLASWASSSCSTCTPIYPPCAAPNPAVCSNSVCVQGHFLGGL